MAALLLVLGGNTETRFGDVLPQYVWQELSDRGYTRLTTFGVPGADPEADITEAGRDRLQTLVEALCS